MQHTSQRPTHRHPVSYAQRTGRMTIGQRRAWDRHWPQWGRAISDLPAAPLDTTEWFGRSAPVVLEIGSGMGESTAAMAEAEPDLDHLAVEVYQPGLAQLLLRCERAGLTNLRLLRGDAHDLLTDHLAADSLAAVRIYFPDPWPKRRHHKRRLIRPSFVALVAGRLRPGGTLHLATDWEPYAEEMLDACTGEPSLRNTAVSGGYAPRPHWRPVTKFEQRAREEGREVRDLIFERV